MIMLDPCLSELKTHGISTEPKLKQVQACCKEGLKTKCDACNESFNII